MSTQNGKGDTTEALRLIAPSAASASPEEAAAVVAALERFMRATAPGPTAGRPDEGADGWRRAAMLEGVERESQGDPPEPWINT
jgi:hypothetical protein